MVKTKQAPALAQPDATKVYGWNVMSTCPSPDMVLEHKSKHDYLTLLVARTEENDWVGGYLCRTALGTFASPASLKSVRFATSDGAAQWAAGQALANPSAQKLSPNATRILESLAALVPVAEHPAVEQEPDLPWLDCDGAILLEGDVATVLPEVSKRLSGKQVRLVVGQERAQKSVEVELVTPDEHGPSRVLLSYLRRLPVLGESVGPAVSPEAQEVLEKIMLVGGQTRPHDFQSAASQASIAELVAAGLVERMDSEESATYRATTAGIAACPEEYLDAVEQVEPAPEPAPAPATKPAPKASPVTMSMVGEMAEAYKVGLRLVPLASIVVTTNTRQVFDESALAELAESVKAHGILQPIVLRPHPTEAGMYELVAGGRRYRAAQLAGLAELPATVRNLTDREFLEVQLLENLQRVDVRPADEAQAFAKLLANGYSAEEIGLKVGKGSEFVTKRARLTELTPFWLELLAQERLPLLAAHELARLPEAGQKLVATSMENSWEFNQGKVLAVDSVRSTINSQVLRQLQEVPWSLEDASLYPEAGPCTMCPKRSGACRGLFDDLQKAGKPDTCLDATCFATKRSLLVQRRIIELRGTGAPLLSQNSYDRAPTGVLGYKYWDSAKEGDKGAVQGLVTDGSNAGHLKWVKLKKEATDAAALSDKKKAERAAEIRSGKINEANRTLLARHLYTQALGGRVLEQHLENELYGQLRSQGGPHTPLRLALVSDFGWEFPEGGEKALRKLTPQANFSGLQAWVKHNVSRLNYDQKLALHFAILGYNCSTFESSNGRLSAYAKQAGANTAHLLKLATEAVDSAKQGQKQEVTA